jgi:hypothetical protein
MRKTVTTACLLTALLVPAGIATAALADTASRPGGSITTPESPTAANGGDQGWGNCGHNSSGGNAQTGDNGAGGGNGGDLQAECNVVTTADLAASRLAAPEVGGAP